MIKRLTKVKKSLALCFVFVFCISIQIALATEYFKQVKSRFGATAGESIAVGDVVYIKTSDGEAYKADADTESSSLAAGVSNTAASADSYIEVVMEGVLAGQTSATPGYRIFTSSTAGGIDIGTIDGMSNTFTQSLGFVLPPLGGGTSSTDYYIRVSYDPSAKAIYTF